MVLLLGPGTLALGLAAVVFERVVDDVAPVVEPILLRVHPRLGEPVEALVRQPVLLVESAEQARARRRDVADVIAGVRDVLLHLRDERRRVPPRADDALAQPVE